MSLLGNYETATVYYQGVIQQIHRLLSTIDDRKYIENLVFTHFVVFLKKIYCITLWLRCAIWVDFYSQIRICMQNMLILIITCYLITAVIINITDQNIVIWGVNVPTTYLIKQ